ncbi:Smr/MutS family protein [Geothrix fuzhouensis]|uniref:Smr/MutS family protein n=1 Tax=Geothrix fuzhouensis TaxID=2966451 RepID=UPI0021477C54|nr:Smr/MutS family protein [Geothrix fuzhouensis]
MAWKQDLAKLKQQLKPEEPVSPTPKPPPKPAPKPQGPGSLIDEDAVFLSAMGLKPGPSPRPAPAGPVPAPISAAQAPAQPPAPPTPPETFEEALKDLKGLKPLSRGPMAKAAPAQAPPSPVAPPVTAAPSLPTEPPVAEAAPVHLAPADQDVPPPSPLPVRFQLAAGMAIEVDGVLDLRGHTLQDAMDRLQDRLGDGLVLGWRTLQVILGPAPQLHEGLLALLASGELPTVARYAQAPVPMGGSQAWLLYLTPSQPQS